jgi:hypothetical protein
MGGAPSGGPNYLFEKSKLDLILKQGPPIFSENGGEDFKKCFIKTGLFNNLLNNLFKKTLKIQGIKIKYALNSYYDSFSYGENVLFFFKKLSYFYKYKKNFLNVLNMSNLTIKKKKLFNAEQNYNFRNDIKGGQFNKDSRFLFYGFYIFQKIKANSFIKKQIYSIHPLNSLKEGGPKIEKWGPPILKRGGGKKMLGVKGFMHGQSPCTKQPGPPSLICTPPFNPLYALHIPPLGGGPRPTGINPYTTNNPYSLPPPFLYGVAVGLQQPLWSPPWGGWSSMQSIKDQPPQGVALYMQSIEDWGYLPDWSSMQSISPPWGGGQDWVARYGRAINPLYGRAISHTAIKNMGFITPPATPFKGGGPLYAEHIPPLGGGPRLGGPGRAHKSIQPYKTGGQTVILPAKENLKNHMNQIKDIFFKVQGESQESLIKKTSSIIHKWSDYYKIIPRNSNKLQFLLVKILWKWCSKRHNHVSNFWIKEKYFFSLNNKKYLFCFLLSVPPLQGATPGKKGWSYMQSI